MRVEMKFPSGTASNPPQIIPLFDGTLEFVPSPVASGTLPTLNDVVPANYSAWPTVGALIVSPLVGAAEPAESGVVRANRIWYSLVKLSQRFLFETIGGTSGLRNPVVIPGRKKELWPDEDPVLFAKHAILGFLQGTYAPAVRGPIDDISGFKLPELIVGADGSATVVITAARRAALQDGLDEDLEVGGDFLPAQRNHPSHPINALVPARYVYNELRSQMDTWSQLMADEIGGPTAPTYKPIFFTRSWQMITDVPECSVLFHRVRVSVEDTYQGESLADVRLPTHGVLFVPENPGSLVGPVTISIDSPDDFRIMLGSTANAWNVRATELTVNIDLDLDPQPHIILRGKLGDELAADPRLFDSGYMACTYFSLRRFVRGYIDHRITGGRLGRKVVATKRLEDEKYDLLMWTHAEKLLVAALADEATVSLLSNGGPDPMQDPNRGNPELRQIMRALFFDSVTVGGKTLTRGEIAYAIWESLRLYFCDEIDGENLTAFFSADGGGTPPLGARGTGAPGAAVYLGIASWVTSDTPEFDTTEIENMRNFVGSGGLRGSRGTLFQFWDTPAVYAHVAHNTAASGGCKGSIGGGGHSIVFARYDDPDNPTKIFVFDYRNKAPGPTSCDIHPSYIQWWSFQAEVWLAATLDE